LDLEDWTATQPDPHLDARGSLPELVMSMMLDNWITVKDACCMDRYELYDDDAAVELQTIGALTRQVMDCQNQIRELVVHLRSRFVPWDAIAYELVVTRQAAQQRYARLCRE
jgi:hypothetical protein